MSKPVALSIAGSDPSGGAGIQADLKTFHQFGVYGEAAITLLTVQNTQRVARVEILDPALVREQIEAVLEDIPPGAVKTGALGNAAMIRMVAGLDLRGAPLVVDPVMVSKHGAPLIAAEAIAALKAELLPRAALVTPNLPEAEALAGQPIASLDGARRAAEAILAMGPQAVLLKGGHFHDTATDLLLTSAGETHTYPAARIATPHTHGTGCTYSAAITALLAAHTPLPEAVSRAKQFITAAIATNPGLGHGAGPVNHHART
ncbi:MAG: bifunctional hydroxymethylpyrimidine kinase/phosphomethylpyrimidine kinase [Bryobacterales bacterium]|nr:bifunctional hydroxymethylpyrimidine kinase/phosphomethylpyrimidine kinase [Bryobacterales bacterium]